MSCANCERLPPPLPARGVLYAAAPIVHTHRALMELLAPLSPSVRADEEGVIVAPIDTENLKRLFDSAERRVGNQELADTRALYLPSDQEPNRRDLLHMHSLLALRAKLRGDWLTALLHAKRLTTHFHAIRECARPERVFGYECLARAVDADGTPRSPGEMFEVARESGLLFYLDRACRISAVERAAQHNIRDKVFVNFNPTTIYAPEYCLQTTMAAISGSSLRPEQIVFEVVESDQIRDERALARIVDYYRDHGFRVALDDLGAGFASLTLLQKLKPDYVKIDRGLIRDVDTDLFKSHITANLIELGRRLGVPVVAEGVETDAEWTWLRDHGTDYVQGFYFSRPQPAPEPTPDPATA